jgi:hypothetical protein
MCPFCWSFWHWFLVQNSNVNAAMTSGHQLWV